MLAHPLSHNLEWRAVLALLGEVGTVQERHDGKFEVTAGDQTIVLNTHHQKDLNPDEVVAVRHFLESLGYH